MNALLGPLLLLASAHLAQANWEFAPEHPNWPSNSSGAGRHARATCTGCAVSCWRPGYCGSSHSGCKGCLPGHKAYGCGTGGSFCRKVEPATTALAATAATGSCLGNDSRCKSRGATHAGCKSLQAEGADCRWHHAQVATSACVDTRASGSGLHGDDSRGSYANGLSSQCAYYKNKNECGTWGKGCEKTCGLCSSNTEAPTTEAPTSKAPIQPDATTTTEPVPELSTTTAEPTTTTAGTATAAATTARTTTFLTPLDRCLASCAVAGATNHGKSYSCNQQLSCDMACKMKYEQGLTTSECNAKCDRTGSSGCSLAVGAATFRLCSTCHRHTKTSIPDQCRRGCAFGDAPASTTTTTAPHDTANCPFNSKVPATCWGNSAFQRCPAGRQAAYDAVMAKRGDTKAMHDVYVALLSGAIPGCKTAATDTTTTPSVATAAPCTVEQVGAQQRQALSALQTTADAIVASTKRIVEDIKSVDLDTAEAEAELRRLEAALDAKNC